MNKTSWLAILAEFGPIFVFFIAGQFTDFFTAVALLMITTLLATALSWWLDKRIPWIPIVSAFFVLLGGAITLVYHAPDAIIFTDTLYYLSITLALGHSLVRKKYLLKKLFGTIFAIDDTGWYILTVRWFIFLLLCAIANEAARHLLTPEHWIEYRFYKTIVVTCFACLQFYVTSKYRIVAESNQWGLRQIQ